MGFWAFLFVLPPGARLAECWSYVHGDEDWERNYLA